MKHIDDIVQALTPRQSEVLDQALMLAIKGEDALTMANVAQAASCSKETIYKWFGPRDQFLQILVAWQASKVRVVPITSGKIDKDWLFYAFEKFAHDWLVVLSSPTSIALNRLAISHACANRSQLGEIVLRQGPFAMRARLKRLILLAGQENVLTFKDQDVVFTTFFGLVVGDMQIRCLLGDQIIMTDKEIISKAKRATQQLFDLFENKRGA